MGRLTPSMGDPDGACMTVLPEVQVIGLAFTTLAGFVSTFAVLVLLGLVARNFIRNIRNPPPGGEWRLIRTHVDAYLLSLLASEILQGLGAMLDIKWVSEAIVYCSDYCTAQGAIQQIGETGVAMGTLAITIHTFFVIFFRWTPGPRSVWIYRIVISFIWTYLILFVVIGYATHHSNTGTNPDVFYSPTPYWCWIGGGFDAERIAGEYFWLWAAALSSIFLYTLLYFRIRGHIQVDPQDWKRIRIRLHPHTHSPDDTLSFLDAPPTTAGKEAMAMIWYPICYTILVLPLSIVRWSTFRPPGKKEPTVPFAVTSVVVTIFGLSGIVNVVLIMLTRRNLLLFGQHRGVMSSTQSGSISMTDHTRERFGSASGFGQGGGGGGVSMQSKGSVGIVRVIGPTISTDSNTVDTTIGRAGNLSNIRTGEGAGMDWTNEHAKPAVGDTGLPIKFKLTPSASANATTGSTGTRRKPVPDFDGVSTLGKKPSQSSIHPLRFSNDRNWGQDLSRSLSDIGGARSSMESSDYGGKDKGATHSATGLSRVASAINDDSNTANSVTSPRTRLQPSQSRPDGVDEPAPGDRTSVQSISLTLSRTRHTPPHPLVPPPRPPPLALPLSSQRLWPSSSRENDWDQPRGREVPNPSVPGGVSFMSMNSMDTHRSPTRPGNPSEEKG